MPFKVNRFHNQMLTRVFIVIGRLSIIIYMIHSSERYFLLIFPFNYIVLIFALLCSIYMLIINIIKLYYGTRSLINKSLKFGNLSLNKLEVIIGKLTCS